MKTIGSVIVGVLIVVVVVLGARAMKGNGDTSGPDAAAKSTAPTPDKASAEPSKPVVEIPSEVANKVPDAFLGSAAAFIKAVADTHEVNLDLHVGPRGDSDAAAKAVAGFKGNATSVRRGFINRGRELEGDAPMPPEGTKLPPVEPATKPAPEAESAPPAEK